MSEMRKWAERVVNKANDMGPVATGMDSHIYDLACAMLADADPSNDASPPARLHGDGVKWVEYGATPNPARWEGYRGVGGEGAPEPDGWITRDEAEQVRKGRAAWFTVSVWPYRMEGICDLPIYIDRLPPEREAEALEAAVSLMADREAEIRADERRRVLEGLTMGASYAEVLACLSPTDEQESPNRSDEP